MIYRIAFAASLGGFLFGFDEGILSGVLGMIQSEFHLDEHHTGVMMGLLPVGAFVAAIGCGRLADWLGRLHLLYGIAILFIAATLTVLVSSSYSMLCIARILLGMSMGMSVVIGPMYIAETAPSELRGKFVAYFQLAITLGILSSYCINLFGISLLPWRWVFATGLIPSVLLLVVAWFLPESPRWLHMRGKVEEAHRVLHRIYHKTDRSDFIEKELKTIQHSMQYEKKIGIWGELFSKRVRASLVLGLLLFFFQQVSGINAVIYYAPIIFKEMHFNSSTVALLATIGIGIVNVLATFLALRWVEKMGRRRLLILGFIGTTITLALVAITPYLVDSPLYFLAAASPFFYIAAFAVSLGPLPYVLISEIFPLKVRGQAISLCACSNWIFNAVVVSTFPTLLFEFGLSFTFILYAFACIIGLLFTLRYVPETRGYSLEEIEEYLHTGSPLSQLPPFSDSKKQLRKKY